MISTREEAQQIWEPHFHRIAAVIEAAWSEWKAVRSWRGEQGMNAIFYKRTVSNYIFDSIAREAHKEFAFDDAFFVDRQPQTFKLIHRAQVARFKKGSVGLLGSNIPTQMALAFMEAEGTLPGLPPETAKVEIIWKANELFTDLESIHLVARDGDDLVWEITIPRSGADVVPIDLETQDLEDDVPAVTVSAKKSRRDGKTSEK